MPTQALVTVGGKVTASSTNTTITNANAEGLVAVIPTSVAGSGVSLGAAGKVTITAASTASINGCFTSNYDNYLLVFDLTTSAAGTLGITLRLSGTDAVTAYDTQRVTFVNATVAAAQSLNAANWVGSGGLGTASGRQHGQLTLFKPAVAVVTGGQIENSLVANPMTATDGFFKGTLQHRTLTAYDGITFAPSTGTFTGTVRVYGYNNN